MINNYIKYKDVQSKNNSILFDYVYETKYAYYVFTTNNNIENKVMNDKNKKIFYITKPYNINDMIDFFKNEEKNIKEASKNYNIFKNTNYFIKFLYCYKYYNFYKSYKNIFNKYGKIIDLSDNNYMKYKLEQIYNSDFFNVTKSTNVINDGKHNNYNRSELIFKGFIGKIEYNKKEHNKCNTNIDFELLTNSNDFLKIVNEITIENSEYFKIQNPENNNIGLKKLKDENPFYIDSDFDVNHKVQIKEKVHSDQIIQFKAIMFQKGNDKVKCFISKLTNNSQKYLLEQIKNNKYIFEIDSLETIHSGIF